MVWLAGRKQPLAGARVDWGHPLSKGLVWLFAPGAPGMGDLIQGGRPTLGSAGSWKPHALGMAHDSSNYTDATSGVTFPWSGRLATITTQFTVAVWATTTTVPYFGIYWCAPIAETYADPFFAIILQRGFFTDAAVLNFGYGTTAGNYRSVTSSTGYVVESASRHRLYGAMRDGTAGTFWRDGALFSSHTFAGNEAVYWANQRGPGLFSRGETSLTGGDVGLQGRSPFAAVWNRPLSATEWVHLYANPFQMLDPGGLSVPLLVNRAVAGNPWYAYHQQ